MKDENIDAEKTVELLFDEAYIERAVKLTGGAVRRLWFIAYTWRWYENAPERPIQRLNYNVAQKAAKGLDVRVLLYAASQVEMLAAIGINTKQLRSDRVLHTKALLVDDTHLFVGSHNLTERGTSENYECTALITDKAALFDFEQYFEKMWNNFTR